MNDGNSMAYFSQFQFLTLCGASSSVGRDNPELESGHPNIRKSCDVV